MDVVRQMNWLSPGTMILVLCLAILLRLWFLAGLSLGYLAGRYLKTGRSLFRDIGTE